MKKQILALIPARGGSKGVPKKNIATINQHPLIEYTINPAMKAKELNYLDDVVVSTDSQEIADIAKQAGASVPFLRPEQYATDQAKSIDVMLHALDFFKNQNVFYESILLLQPTTPLRLLDDIIESIKIFKKSQADSLISCYLEEYICDMVMYQKNNLLAKPLNTDHNKGIRRQELEDIYVRNGAIYITNVDYLRKNRVIMSDCPAMYVMPRDRSVNIDTKDDLELVKWKLSR
jgi:CMP-N-acetylneuraminic acid synthetase